MARRLKPWRQIRLLSASPLRAWLEALALGIGLLLLVWLARNGITPGERQNGLFVALLSAMSWYAIRLRHSGGTWWLRIGIEMGDGIVPAVLVGGAVLVSGLYLMPECRKTIDDPLAAFTTIFIRLIRSCSWAGNPDYRPPVRDHLPSSPPADFRASSPMLSCAASALVAELRSCGGGLSWTLTHLLCCWSRAACFLFATLITINLVMYYSSEADPSGFLDCDRIIPVLIRSFFDAVLVVIVLPPALTFLLRARANHAPFAASHRGNRPASPGVTVPRWWLRARTKSRAGNDFNAMGTR